MRNLVPVTHQPLVCKTRIPLENTYQLEYLFIFSSLILSFRSNHHFWKLLRTLLLLPPMFSGVVSFICKSGSFVMVWILPWDSHFDALPQFACINVTLCDLQLSGFWHMLRHVFITPVLQRIVHLRNSSVHPFYSLPTTYLSNNHCQPLIFSVPTVSPFPEVWLLSFMRCI